MRDFPYRQEKLANLRGKKQNQNNSKSTKPWLNVFKEWKVQRNIVRKVECIPPHELDAILSCFLANIQKKDGHQYEPESLAVMQCWIIISQTH